MKTPCGIELQVGQVWRERDGRFFREVTVASWNTITDRIKIRHANRTTVAALSRFNGRSGGYEFVRRPAENPVAADGDHV